MTGKFQRIVLSTLVFLLAVVVLITYHSPSSGEEAIRTYKQEPFCTILPESLIYYDSTAQYEMIGSRGLYWKEGQTLRIYFSDGSQQVQTKVLNTAKAWLLITGLKFDQVFYKTDPSDVRISFHCSGYNSLIGTQSAAAAKNFVRTMCLEGLDTTTDEALFTRTVLHEFGHAMGFLHELQNPNVKIQWDTAALYKYYYSTYLWKHDSVDKWVLKLYQPSDIDESDYDPNSIMMYAVPAYLTKNKLSIPWPKGLSNNDIIKTKSIYKQNIIK